MIVAARPPVADTVIFDGRCRFCRGQIGILRACDPSRSLRFVSLHDPAVGRDFPEIPRDDLMAQMHVVDARGRIHGGVGAVRYLARRLPLLWPVALPLHIPGSSPLWRSLYRFIARHRYRIAGAACDDGTCRL